VVTLLLLSSGFFPVRHRKPARKSLRKILPTLATRRMQEKSAIILLSEFSAVEARRTIDIYILYLRESQLIYFVKYFSANEICDSNSSFAKMFIYNARELLWEVCFVRINSNNRRRRINVIILLSLQWPLIKSILLQFCSLFSCFMDVKSKITSIIYLGPLPTFRQHPRLTSYI
jgi:hypothetical protein